MSDRDIEKEQLLKENEELKARMDSFKQLVEEYKKLKEELRQTKEELEIQTWGLRKSNESIRLLYKELEKKNAELRRLDELKSEFVSTVSHELRTPLAIIKEGLSLLLDEVPGKINENQRDILQTTESNISRLGRIIDDLLDISKIEAGKVELRRRKTDIILLVKDIYSKWLLESCKKNHDFKLFTPDGPIYIYIDPDKITQVLNNLISNAMKYTPEGGKIKVVVNDKGRSVEVSVADNGVGIAKENLPKVFGKFQQFDRKPGPGIKGTGLGLAISKQLVEMHKGRISVDSELNKGTTFTFELPKLDIRVVFSESIGARLKEAQEKDIHLSLLVLHIDGLQELERSISPEEVSKILNNVEEIIKQKLRASDTVIRDTQKLAILLLGTKKEEVGVVKERIEKELSDYLRSLKDTLPGEVSIWFSNATYPDDASSEDELLDKTV